MRYMITLFCAWAMLGAFAGAQPSGMDAAARRKLARTGITVLLPAGMPRAFGTLAATTVLESDAHGYEVAYSPVAGCGGALSCAPVHVSGRRGRGAASDAVPGERLRLPDGTIGTFTPRDCSGAGCTEASLRFARADATYEIDAKIARDDRASVLDLYRHLRRLSYGR